MIDRATAEQAETVVAEMSRRLDAISTNFESRDADVHVLPTAVFLAFVSVALLAGKTQRDFAAWIPAGFKIIDEAILRRGGNVARHYGRGRRCMITSREVVQTVMDGAHKEVNETKLALNRKLALETLLYKRLLEFCAVFRLLDPLPDGAREMMAKAGGLCEEVFAAGYVTRNEIRIR